MVCISLASIRSSSLCSMVADLKRIQRGSFHTDGRREQAVKILPEFSSLNPQGYGPDQVHDGSVEGCNAIQRLKPV